VFGRNCTACHGTENGAAGLPLGDGVSYAHLVNQASKNSEKVRVQPYSIQNSFLMDVLTDEALNLSPSHSTLYPDDINLLKAWIAAGAENN
jgi:mono/diheme cytochrome c family protein